MPWKSVMYHQNGRRRKYVVLERKIQAVEWHVRANRGVSLLHLSYAMLLDKKIRVIVR